MDTGTSNATRCRTKSNTRVNLSKGRKYYNIKALASVRYVTTASCNMGMYPGVSQKLYRYDECWKHVFRNSRRRRDRWYSKLVIYNRQAKTSRQQDFILRHINHLEEKNTKILTNLEGFAKHHEQILNNIFFLNEKILALDKKIQSKL